MPTPTDLDAGQSPSAFLSAARPLSGRWERGVSFPDASCSTPSVTGECPSGSVLLTADRPVTESFQPVSLAVALTCTAMGDLDLTGMAATELDRVAGSALARELLTGEASERDAGTHPANASLQSAAASLGAQDSAAALVAALDTALHANGGRGGYILLSPYLGTMALSAAAIYREGARWRTAAGSTVIIDGGFDGRGPAGSSTPALGAPQFGYATANVWAARGRRETYGHVDRAVNDATARASDLALVAFTTCATYVASWDPTP